MAFSPVAWAYKAVITSAKLQQMVNNLLAHDHRADGSQGATLVDDWVTMGTVTGASGWTVLTKRYRLLLGGALVAFDLQVQRTGADLVATDAAGANPGNLADTQILSGIPSSVASTLPSASFVCTDNAGSVVCRFNTDGTVDVVSATTSGGVKSGSSFYIRGVLWRT
jgi:hypothetical protein